MADLNSKLPKDIDHNRGFLGQRTNPPGTEGLLNLEGGLRGIASRIADAAKYALERIGVMDREIRGGAQVSPVIIDHNRGHFGQRPGDSNSPGSIDHNRGYFDPKRST